MTGTGLIIIGVCVGIVGAASLTNPGGSDALSAVNIFLGGLNIGLGVAMRFLGVRV